jgi:hypothetical protein
MTKLEFKDFKPTEDMLSSAKALLMAKAWVATVKPIVEGYQKKILAELQFTNKREVEMLSKRFPEIKEEVILDHDRSYNMSDEDFAIYHKRCKEERDKAKLKVENDDFCPLLVAESMERKARDILIEAMEPISKLKRDDFVMLEDIYKMEELSLKLLTPFLKQKGMV